VLCFPSHTTTFENFVNRSSFGLSLTGGLPPLSNRENEFLESNF
jgi:hypothetical protein